MSWLLIALIGPILYAVANHIDKHVIERYLKGGVAGALIIFSSLFSIVALPVLTYFEPSVLDVTLLQGVYLALNGMLVVFAFLAYFYALTYDEASYVVPWYQTIPIFGFILGYFILGEKISQTQALASAFILAGAIILSLDFGGKKMHFKREVAFLMLGASLLYAINGVVFKVIATDAGFWVSVFWGLVGKVILGFAFLAFIPSYRNQYLYLLRHSGLTVLGFNSLSEFLSMIAEAAMQYVTLLVPVGIALLANSFQPFFVLIIGSLIAFFWPSKEAESLRAGKMTQKVVGIAIMVLGSYLIGV
ncbi:MAG: EamA family transporter [Candidatus Paceibacterota bacterium]|jgi:drug/metabolite transporter (DMT)-like permease